MDQSITNKTHRSSSIQLFSFVFPGALILSLTLSRPQKNTQRPERQIAIDIFYPSIFSGL
ncbi:hypothetical protein BCR41DRAFT_361043, partial [Lobosporangium transversale]